MRANVRADGTGNGVDPVVYLVTAEPVRLAALETVTAAVSGGVTMVQLRDKHADTDTRIRYLQQLQRRLSKPGTPSGAAGPATRRIPEVTLLVNDDLEAARAVPGVGVHLGPDDTHPATAREELGDHVCIGWSLHDHAQLADRQALAAIDYAAASPVWPTPTKTDTTPAWGLPGLHRLRTALDGSIRLIGIGGIHLDNAAAVIEAGADGVAVVSAIWSATDPSTAASQLRAVVENARSSPNTKQDNDQTEVYRS